MKTNEFKKLEQLGEAYLKSLSNENLVVSSFGCSVITEVACKHLNRRFLGIESDESYFSMAKEKMEKLQINKEKTTMEWVIVDMQGLSPKQYVRLIESGLLKFGDSVDKAKFPALMIYTPTDTRESKTLMVIETLEDWLCMPNSHKNLHMARAKDKKRLNTK